MKFKSTILICLIMMILTLSIYSTPGAGYKNREILLGANDSIYISFSIKRAQPGSYYTYSDSSFLKYFSNNTGKLIKKELIRVTEYKANSDVTQWSSNEVKDLNDVNIGDLFRKYSIDYAFPSAIYSNENITMDEKGLVVSNRDYKNITVLTFSDLLEILSVYDLNNVILLPTYATNSFIFFQFQIGDFCCIDGEYTQTIIPVSISELANKWNETYK